MRKILVVEDNEKNRQLFRIILDQMKIDITEAKDGHEAIDFIKNNCEKIKTFNKTIESNNPIRAIVVPVEKYI